ncbi:MAG TPA: FecR/PupR family sigma factor regulator [Burkholderiaceae bacterium]|nr:FecR/PupR family sigma factor regulator [Burkholderiaceae bacterium]
MAGEPPKKDSIADAAIGWVMALHDAPHDPAVRDALAQWLAADPAHRVAYAEARRVWLLTGLLPPSAVDDDSPAASVTAPPQRSS